MRQKQSVKSLTIGAVQHLLLVGKEMISDLLVLLTLLDAPRKVWIVPTSLIGYIGQQSEIILEMGGLVLFGMLVKMLEVLIICNLGISAL